MSILRKISTITDKGQTTVPKPVREALGIGAGDRVAFVIDENLRVVMERVDDKEEDPVIDGFLDFLARDMKRNPAGSILSMPEPLRRRMAGLTGGDIDLEAPIDGDVDL